MPSFDVVSKLDWSEVKNAINQAEKEVVQRFDFRGTDAGLEYSGQTITVRANAEERAWAVWHVVQDKLVRRNVSLKHFKTGNPEVVSKGHTKIVVSASEGIEKEPAGKIIKVIKDSKLKVQTSIQQDTVRVVGKKRDDLQAVIALLKGADLDLDLQYVNFRD